MTRNASRKQARRFYGAMGAVMRQSARWLDAGRQTRTDTVIRRAHGPREACFDDRIWHAN